MKKFLVLTFVLALLGIIAQLYEAGSCRDRVERLKLTGDEAENEYKKCISF